MLVAFQYFIHWVFFNFVSVPKVSNDATARPGSSRKGITIAVISVLIVATIGAVVVGCVYMFTESAKEISRVSQMTDYFCSLFHSLNIASRLWQWPNVISKPSKIEFNIRYL